MDRFPVDVLRCPQCSGAVEPNESGDGLGCRRCPLTYPLSNGVPTMVIGEAIARPIAIDPEFEQLVAEAVAAPFSGWDLAWLESRWTTTTDGDEPLIQTYERRARELIADASSVLDLGTGGGERLALLAPFQGRVLATELIHQTCALPPNV